LGSAPGGWSQVIVPIIESHKDKPSLIAVDINKMNPINGCMFIQGDFEDENIKNKIMEANNFEKFDVICSDMCPEFVGEKFYDHVNTFQLNTMVINFSFKMLKRNGILLLKTFDGTMQNEIYVHFN
jgi:23S rRNA (uridine2552-2'-O)-methyltransferase